MSALPLFSRAKESLSSSTHDNSFSAIIAFKHAFQKVSLAIRTPIGLFRIIGLHGILTFHFQRNDQVWCGILIRTSIFLDVARHVGDSDNFKISQERISAPSELRLVPC